MVKRKPQVKAYRINSSSQLSGKNRLMSSKYGGNRWTLPSHKAIIEWQTQCRLNDLEETCSHAICIGRAHMTCLQRTSLRICTNGRPMSKKCSKDDRTGPPWTRWTSRPMLTRYLALLVLANMRRFPGIRWARAWKGRRRNMVLSRREDLTKALNLQGLQRSTASSAHAPSGGMLREVDAQLGDDIAQTTIVRHIPPNPMPNQQLESPASML